MCVQFPYMCHREGNPRLGQCYVKAKNKHEVVTKCPKTRAGHWPQIFRGASSSSRMGWLRKISLDLIQRPRTSASVIWTILPGRHPRTGEKRKDTISSVIIIISGNPQHHQVHQHETMIQVFFTWREHIGHTHKAILKSDELCNGSVAYSCLVSAILKKPTA